MGRALKWAAICGGTGFALGFFGPVIVDPGANQGPLLGLFITGPGGAILGFILGLLPLEEKARTRVLAVLFFLGVVGLIYGARVRQRPRAGAAARAVRPTAAR